MFMTGHRFSGTLLVALAIAVAGCASGGKQSGGEKAFETFQRTQIGLTQAQQQVDKIMTTMDQFQYSGNLNNAFQNYKAAVAELDKSAVQAKRRADAMRENAPMYTAKWQKEMDSISDPSIKASVESRREAVRANFAQVRAAADDARQAYEPFMRDLKEIQQALSINLSPAALPGLKPAMDRARSEGQTLKAKLSALQKQLDNIERGMTASGKTA
jgi:type IV pilus biogenesis protein CpaD/CtpE